MEKNLQIAWNLLNNQELLGKQSLTINEIKEILLGVDKLISNENKTEFVNNTETPKQFFKSILNKITAIKTNTGCPAIKFYMIGENVFIERNLKNNNFYIRYIDCWSVLESEFNLRHGEISELTKNVLEEHFGCKVNTTYYCTFFNLEC